MSTDYAKLKYVEVLNFRPFCQGRVVIFQLWHLTLTQLYQVIDQRHQETCVRKKLKDERQWYWQWRNPKREVPFFDDGKKKQPFCDCHLSAIVAFENDVPERTLQHASFPRSWRGLRWHSWGLLEVGSLPRSSIKSHSLHSAVMAPVHWRNTDFFWLFHFRHNELHDSCQLPVKMPESSKTPRVLPTSLRHQSTAPSSHRHATHLKIFSMIHQVLSQGLDALIESGHAHERNLAGFFSPSRTDTIFTRELEETCISLRHYVTSSFFVKSSRCWLKKRKKGCETSQKTKSTLETGKKPVDNSML